MTGHTFDPGHHKMIANFMHCVGTKAFAARKTGVQIQASQFISRVAFQKLLNFFELSSLICGVDIIYSYFTELL